MQSNNVYPSIDELMPEAMLGIIPASLAKEIAYRYETLGPKYLSEAHTKDGRPVNSMMFTSRIQNCREEVVDAVFCILGWIFKEIQREGHIKHPSGIPIGNDERFEGPPDSAYDALRGLITVYSILVAEFERDPNI